ncbi:MAG: hypothetical protein Q9219_000900 [cf. Caloplaca sp. 3 TL-2023]
MVGKTSPGSTRKRSREDEDSVSPSRTVGPYAPPFNASKSTEDPKAKRRRQSESELIDNEEAANENCGTIKTSDMLDKSKTTEQEAMTEIPEESNASHGLDVNTAAVNLINAACLETSDTNATESESENTPVTSGAQQGLYPTSQAIDAAASHFDDTESEPDHKLKDPDDRKGLDSIVEAIDYVERSSSSPLSVAHPSSATPRPIATKNRIETPRRVHPWTPVNPGHTWPGRTLRAPKHSDVSTSIQSIAFSRGPATRASLKSQRLIDEGEEGRNEQDSYPDRKFGHR